MRANQTSLMLLLMCFLVFLSGCNSNSTSTEENTPKIESEENISTVKSADDNSIFYETRGEGDTTIVFVHCWTCNSSFWQPQIEYFSQNYQVIRLDLAGHGKSEGKRQQYTMAAFGKDVAAVVNEVATDKVILVGHSMGGPVVIEAAKLLGDRVVGIVGVDVFYTPFAYPTSETEIEAFVQPFKDDFSSASEQLVRSMFTPAADPQLIESTIKQMGSANPEMAVNAITEIFIWNAQQGAADLAQFSSKIRNINGAPTGQENALHESVTLIPGVGHFVAQAKPGEFNQILEQIITEFETN